MSSSTKRTPVSSRVVKRIIFAAIAYLSALSGLPAFANVRIGNGGEGVEINGQLKLRDFVKGGEYHLPGLEVDPEIGRNEILWSPALGLELNEALLVTVVAKIAKISEPLAESVRLATKGCWVAVDHPLWLSNREDSLDVIGLRRVPIAVRGFPFQSCVSVESRSWQRLSDIDKVGLIVHEAVSALLRPQCHKDWCGQDGAMIRTIVYSLFHADELGLRELEQSWLTILDFNRLGRSTFRGPESIAVFGFDKELDGEELLLDVSDPITIAPQIPKLTRQICKLKPNQLIIIRVSRDSRCVRTHLETRGGRSQIVMRPGERLSHRTFYLREPSENVCYERLFLDLGNWFGAEVAHRRSCQ